MRWRRLLSASWQMRREVERQVRVELQGHVDQLVEDLQAAGLSEAQARRQARQRFGDLEAHVRAGRDIRVRGLRGTLRSERLRGLGHDLVSAYRSLRARPIFALSAAVMLGLGIGAATLLSSLVQGVLFEPLPFDEPAQLYRIHGGLLTTVVGRGPSMAPEEVLDWRPLVARSFSDVAAYHPLPYSVNLSGLGTPVEAGLTEVTTNFFTLLGQRMLLGRYFTPADRAASVPVAVIGERLWRSHWSADPEILGREVMINGRPHGIVGVAPSTAQLPADVDVWVPLGLSWDTLFVRGARYFSIVGRLRPGVPLEAAASDLRALQQHLSDLLEGRSSDRVITLEPLHDNLVDSARSPLWLLLGAIGVLLVVALANLASYLLVRSRAREAEFAVRAALGAGRRRLLQQSFAESALLALAGLFAGSMVAAWSVGLVRGSGLPLPRLESLTVDWRLFAIALAISTICALTFGLWPALRASRPDGAWTLRPSSRHTSVSRRNPRELLVVTQVALAVLLAAGAVLLTRSYARLLAVDNGFDGEVLTFAARLDSATFPEWSDAHAFIDELTDRLRELPGVEAVGAASLLPLADRNWFGLGYHVEGEERSEDREFAVYQTATPGFLDAIGVELRAGRDFTAADTEGAAPVAVVNEEFVRIFAPGTDPRSAVGRRVIEARVRNPETFELVGVVADVRRSGPHAEVRPEIYLPVAQARGRSEFYALRLNGDPALAAAAIRDVVSELAPTLPIYEMSMMDERLHGELTQPRLLAQLFALFGAASTLLCAFGLYAVVAHRVAARRHEIGVRLAVGATRRRVFVSLLRGGALRLAAGLLIGLAAYVPLARAVDVSLLFETGVYDPWALAAVVALVSAATMTGVAGAALRTLRLDPAVALRSA